MSHPNGHERGLTLVELGIACAVLSIAAVTTIGFARTSQQSAGTVHTEAESSRSLRQAADYLSHDVRQTSSTVLTVTTLTDQNHQVTMQHPVSVSGGVVTWGVYDPVLGTSEAARTKTGWSVRYTVLPAVNAADGRRLVRQLLDGGGNVQRAQTLVRHLESGAVTPPGFRFTQSGTLWNATISARTGSGSGPVRSRSYDLALMNN